MSSAASSVIVLQVRTLFRSLGDQPFVEWTTGVDRWGNTVRTMWECLSQFATPAWRRSAPDVLRVGGDGVPGVGGGDLEQRAVKYCLVVPGDGLNGCRQRQER